MTDKYLQDSLVMAHLRCETKDAKFMGLLDFERKVKSRGDYDIGGTYTSGEPDFWFTFTSSITSSNSYNVDVFVCNRRPGSFTINLGNFHKKSTWFSEYDSLNNTTTCTFDNLPENNFSFLRSYSITKGALDKLGSEVLLAVNIICENIVDLDEGLIRQLKLNHEIKKNITYGKFDLQLVSTDGEKHLVHKLAVAAHSEYFRDILREMSTDCIQLDETSENVKALIDFIYSGTIDINSENCTSLMNLGIKYKLHDLCELTQHALPQQLTVENAIDILLLACNNDLLTLKQATFDFISRNQIVFQSKAWTNIQNVEIMKDLFKFVSSKGMKIN